MLGLGIERAGAVADSGEAKGAEALVGRTPGEVRQRLLGRSRRHHSIERRSGTRSRQPCQGDRDRLRERLRHHPAVKRVQF